MADILIVDDEIQMRQMLKKMLRKTAHEITMAENGLSALERFGEKKYDLAIIDLNMPKIGGRELIEQIRETDKDMALIVLTGHGDPETAYELLKIFEISDFLNKPLNSPSHLLFSVQNALEKRQLKRELKEQFTDMEKMVELAEAANRLKGQFLDMVSHELRTPLTTLIGPLGIIRDELKGSDFPDAKEMTELAIESANRMLLIVEDLLCVTRLASGKMKFHCAPSSVAEMVRLTVKTNASFAQKHGVEFVLGNLLPEFKIMVDLQRFGQIMDNLLSNAVKYGTTPENKQVAVSVVRRQGDVARVLVADKGQGIPEDFQPYVFDRFSMADSSDVRAKGGLGLGMLITKGFVQCMGGAIGFDSNPGTGTTFWVQFPEFKKVGR